MTRPAECSEDPAAVRVLEAAQALAAAVAAADSVAAAAAAAEAAEPADEEGADAEASSGTSDTRLAGPAYVRIMQYAVAGSLMLVCFA